MNLVKFLEETVKNAGATYSLNGLKLPTKGYFVSLSGRSLVIPSDLDETSLPNLSTYIKVNSSLLGENDKYLGSWINEGEIILDVTKHFSDLETALHFGMSNEQLSIYDIARSKCIDIPLDQKSGTYSQLKSYRKQAINKILAKF
jgi:hypothetical protein